MKLMIIDSQGGGIGRAVILKLIQAGIQAEIIALGSNAIAANNMLKAGAHGSATGENAILYNCKNASADDFIIGPVGIIGSNSMLGEISPVMAQAVSESPAKKLLVPMNKCNIHVLGTAARPMAEYIDEIISLLK